MKELNRAIRKFWDSSTPYIHICGFLIMVGTMVFFAGGKWSKIDDYDARLAKLEVFEETTGKDIADMRRSLIDIHDALLGKRMVYNDSTD